MHQQPKKVPKSVKKALTQGLRDADLAEVAAWFFHAVGGSKPFAEILHQEFTKAPQGSLLRQRVLEMVIQLAKFADTKRGPRTDAENLTNEDLEREILNLLPKMKDDADVPTEQPGAAG